LKNPQPASNHLLKMISSRNYDQKLLRKPPDTTYVAFV